MHKKQFICREMARFIDHVMDDNGKTIQCVEKKRNENMSELTQLRLYLKENETLPAEVETFANLLDLAIIKIQGWCNITCKQFPKKLQHLSINSPTIDADCFHGLEKLSHIKTLSFSINRFKFDEIFDPLYGATGYVFESKSEMIIPNLFHLEKLVFTYNKSLSCNSIVDKYTEIVRNNPILKNIKHRISKIWGCFYGYSMNINITLNPVIINKDHVGTYPKHIRYQIAFIVWCLRKYKRFLPISVLFAHIMPYISIVD